MNVFHYRCKNHYDYEIISNPNFSKHLNLIIGFLRKKLTLFLNPNNNQFSFSKIPTSKQNNHGVQRSRFISSFHLFIHFSPNPSNQTIMAPTKAKKKSAEKKPRTGLTWVLFSYFNRLIYSVRRKNCKMKVSVTVVDFQIWIQRV